MAEAMSDERLAYIRRLNVTPALADCVAEIERLRAALAARPEPQVGPHLADPVWRSDFDFVNDDKPARVVATRPEPIGYVVLAMPVSQTLEEARQLQAWYATQEDNRRQVCGLIPVPEGTG